MSPMPSSLTQLCWESQVTICRYIPYAKFYYVSFGCRYALAYSLIGIGH